MIFAVGYTETTGRAQAVCTRGCIHQPVIAVTDTALFVEGETSAEEMVAGEAVIAVLVLHLGLGVGHFLFVRFCSLFIFDV